LEAGSELPARLGVLIPLGVRLYTAGFVLRAPLNLYDEGLYLTIARFTSLSRLPYRDLWTLYGPGTSLIGPIVDAFFGRQLIAQRLADFAISLVLVAGVYQLARRFINWPIAAAFASAVGAVAVPPHHFARAIAAVVWGLWFIRRYEEEDKPSSLWIGCLLLGMSFLGRYEFSLLAVGLVIVVAAYLYRQSPRRVLARAVAAGLVAPLAFWSWLIATVPANARYENFINYPLRLYPQPHCRGIPTSWRQTLLAPLAPFSGRLWSGQEVSLMFGNLLPPLLATLLLLKAYSSWRRRERKGLLLLLTALTTFTLFYEMRARAGGFPVPIAPMTLIALAMALGTARSKKVAVVAGYVVSALMSLVLMFGWLPFATTGWIGWPDYAPVLGFIEATPAHNLYAPEAIDPIVRAVHRYARPADPVFVALTNNQGHYANAAALYWIVDRPPVSRFIEFNPCLTDRNDIQAEIVQDLERTNVVVQSTLFANPPPKGQRGTVLDDYLREEFVPVAETTVAQSGERYVVLVRRTAADEALRGGS
jgi:hypothetical protein